MNEKKSWLQRNLPQFFDKANAMRTLEIPLFPLNTVLFPGGLLPIRVFEQRYMDMTKSCMKEELPFGVCLIKEGSEVGQPAIPMEVGCLARIINWDMPQLGILNLETEGLQRFSIQESRTEDNGLLMATVVTVTSEESQPIPDALQVCASVLQRIIDQVGEDKFVKPFEFNNAVWVGYRLAEVLPLKLTAKQDMLEMNDPITRLHILRKFLVQQGLAQ